MLNSVFVHSCDANAALSESKLAASRLGVKTPSDPATPPVSNTGGNSSDEKLKQCATGCQIREARGNNVKISKV